MPVNLEVTINQIEFMVFEILGILSAGYWTAIFVFAS